MNISENFIRRPIATSLLMAGIALFGVIAYRALPVSDLPQVDYPTITVSAGLPGANPDTMASAVATPLERQFTTIAGLDSMISSSSQGSTNITLQFSLDREIDGATVDVETAIAEAMPLLPPGMPAPPSFRKVNPGDTPILSFFVTSPTMRLSDLDEYAETMVAQRVSMVSAWRRCRSSARRSTRCACRWTRISSPPIKSASNEVGAAIGNWNINLPTGTLYGNQTAYNVMANGQLMKAWQYKPLVVSYRNGVRVRLSDVANVIDSVQDDKQNALLYGGEYGTDGTKGITMAVFRQPGSNTIDVVDNIKALLPFFREQMPPTVHLGLRGDRSKNIREAFQDIQFTMAATLGLVIMVIFLFLRNFSATMIPAMALPFSIVGTFAVMYLLNFSINNISHDGADSLDRLRGGRRHRHAGEYRPPHRAWRKADGGGAPRLEGNRLHHRFDDPLAGGGVHPDSVHGRNPGPPVPRVCGHHLHGHHDLRHRFRQSHPDALQPLPARDVAQRPRHVLPRDGAHLRRYVAFYRVTLGWVLRHRPVMLAAFLVVLGITGYLYVIVPRASSPIPTTIPSTFRRRPRRALPTTRW